MSAHCLGKPSSRDAGRRHQVGDDVAANVPEVWQTASPDLPWCPQCYEPIKQFAVRAPLHHGDFVGSPIPTGGHIPHWSRWEKSATTFGPVGRVVATMLLFATLLPAITSGGFMYLITFPI